MQVFLRGNPTISALWASFATVLVLTLVITLAEPMVAHGDQVFTIDQEITGELSFLTDPGDVVMDTALTGITANSSFGTSTFNVSTNNLLGYTVDIKFSTGTAMQATATDDVIPNYDTGDGNGDYDMSVGAGEAFFAYSVYNETTPLDVDPSFEDNGSNSCGGGGSATYGKCWYNQTDASTDVRIIDASSNTAASGATSSVLFQVQVGNNSGVATGWYRATATLTALLKS